MSQPRAVIVSLHSIISLDVRTIKRIYIREHLVKTSNKYSPADLTKEVVVEYLDQEARNIAPVVLSQHESGDDGAKAATDVLIAATKEWKDGVEQVKLVNIGRVIDSLFSEDDLERFLHVAQDPKIMYTRIEFTGKRRFVNGEEDDEPLIPANKKQKVDDAQPQPMVTITPETAVVASE